MKLPPSALLIKLFSDLLLVSRRSSTGGKVLLGSLVVLSVLITSSHFPAIELPSINLAAATPATSNLPLFGNPTSEDFMSYAVAIMPTVPGANLNISNVAGSTNCDLLVPVTYIDAGCMNSLPLLFPFNEPQQTNITEPINQTFYNDYSNSSALDLSIGVASDNITAGETQTVTVSVSNQNSTQPIPGAVVLANVTDSFNSLLHEYSGTADEIGQVSFPFVIPADAASDIYTVSVLASADGFENASASTTFDVIGSGDFFDNSTFDNFSDSSSSDGSSSSDNCCDSSNNNDDFTSPEVKSTDPSDGDNNVALNTDIKVTFDEKIDDNTIDSGSLDLFNLDGSVDPFVQSVSTSSKSATFSLHEALLPNTHYEATISSDIEDTNGNFLDCSASKGVDSSCQWQFSTSGGSPQITLSPNSGPVDTPMDVTGTGFDPNSIVTLTFDSTTVATATTTSTGNFAANFNVPLSSPAGDQTVRATQGGNSASDTFTVTSLIEPVIVLEPSSGPTNTSVTVTVTGAGFDPSSTITIEFDGTPVDTNPSTVTSTPAGFFTATFNVQPSSNGDYTVKATQGSKSASKTFKVAPVIFLDPISGPSGTPVTVTGAGFDPASTVTINFGSTSVTTTPTPLTTNSSGGFSANFNVPLSSSIGGQIVKATHGSNSASKTFTVTVTSLSSLVATSRSNVSSFEHPNNQSNATLLRPSSNQSNATIPIVTNSSFDTAESNSIIAPPLNTSSAQATENISKAIRPNDKELSSNTSSAQATENSSTAPHAKQMNNTSLIASTDNTINNNPPATTSTQNNDTSNNKKSSEKSTSIGQPKSEDQLASTALTNNNTTHEKASSVTQDKNIIDAKHETSQNKLTSLRSENDSNSLVEKVKNKVTSSKDSENQPRHVSAPEKPSSVTDDKTITKVKNPKSDNQPEKQSVSSDSIKRDRALFYKYLDRDNDKNKVTSEQTKVNNRPLAINDEATTESNIPVKINILSNDKDPDGDKLSVMGVSRPVRGTIESDADGTITYSPLKSWSGTERFGYTISDGRGGVATGTVTVIVENHPPEAEDQDVSVNANSPIKIKLEAKDPDDDKLKFVLDSKPSHGRIAQFSSSTGTLAYIPDANYGGKDEFTFKVHDGTVFSKDAKVSIKIQNNEKSSSNDRVQRDQQQPNKQQEPNQTPTNDKKSNDEKSNNDTPPNDSNQQSPSSTQNTEQQKIDQKVEEQQSSPSEEHTGEPDPTSNGDSQPTS